MDSPRIRNNARGIIKEDNEGEGEPRMQLRRLNSITFPPGVHGSNPVDFL